MKRRNFPDRVSGAFRRWADRHDAPPATRGPVKAANERPEAVAGAPREGAHSEAPRAEAHQQADPPPNPGAESQTGQRGNDRQKVADSQAASAVTDWYEVLQISRNADPDTIHRVYRIMAARFHPDNPRTGNTERFLLMKRAYSILSDPALRAEYDASYQPDTAAPLPVFQLNDFVDGVDGERNRRLGILSLLYNARRLSESKPGISVLELEQRMSIPREYLRFTLWYLRLKGYVQCEDSSDYAVTPEGVDYVEQHSSTNTVIRELLNAGPHTAVSTC